MTTNLSRYEKDLDDLIARGELLHLSMHQSCFPKQFEEALAKTSPESRKKLPDFLGEYQTWYSESLALLRQVLPDRLADFTRHYEKPKSRKELTSESYRIEDYLQGLQVTQGLDKRKVVGQDAAIPHFQQQLAIIKSAKARFSSSLFEIRQLLQADLFDSELDAAQYLSKQGFTRAAGALAGVVLERHLAEICKSYGVKVSKNNPTIGDLNDLLKNAGAIDVPQWRFIQHLADIRNLCDHKKKADPSPAQVDDLIAGVTKTIKTVH